MTKNKSNKGELSDENAATASEVVYFDAGFVPPVEQVKARNILHRPRDTQAQSDLLSGKTDKPAVIDEIVGNVKFSPEPYIPKPEEIKAQNIQVCPSDLLVQKTSAKLVAPVTPIEQTIPPEMCEAAETIAEKRELPHCETQGDDASLASDIP